MPEIHKVECSRCGAKEDLKEEDMMLTQNKSKLPDDWEEFPCDHSGVIGHLCPTCYHDYLCVEELFLKKELKADIKNPKLQGNIKRAKNNE